LGQGCCSGVSWPGRFWSPGLREAFFALVVEGDVQDLLEVGVVEFTILPEAVEGV